MQFLLLIFIFLFALIVIVFSAFRGILSFLFKGLFGKSNQSNGQKTRQQYRSEESSSNSREDTKKVFSKDEGEYVKFEEID